MLINSQHRNNVTVISLVFISHSYIGYWCTVMSSVISHYVCSYKYTELVFVLHVSVSLTSRQSAALSVYCVCAVAAVVHLLR